MPTEKTITVYTIQELEGRAQQRAFDTLREWSTDRDWWTCTYYDAKEIGAEISGFDVYRRSIDLTLTDDAAAVANSILENHGDFCGTYALAKSFLADRAELLITKRHDQDLDDMPEYDDLVNSFTYALGEEYLAMLRRELEEIESEEYLIDFADANEYQFTIDGKAA